MFMMIIFHDFLAFACASKTTSSPALFEQATIMSGRYVLHHPHAAGLLQASPSSVEQNFIVSFNQLMDKLVLIRGLLSDAAAKLAVQALTVADDVSSQASDLAIRSGKFALASHGIANIRQIQVNSAVSMSQAQKLAGAGYKLSSPGGQLDLSLAQCLSTPATTYNDTVLFN